MEPTAGMEQLCALRSAPHGAHARTGKDAVDVPSFLTLLQWKNIHKASHYHSSMEAKAQNVLFITHIPMFKNAFKMFY